VRCWPFSQSRRAAAQSAGLSFAARFSQFRHGLTRTEWVKLGGMASAIIGLNVLGWVTLAAFVAPHHYSLGTKTFGLGVGVTAYTLGMRHAFDSDHIAAIDNTTRKLMNDGKRPMSVGFWFSLGHSTIVFALAFLLTLGVKALVGPVKNDNSNLHHYTGLIGTTASGTFLVVIAAINIIILVGILKVFRDMRQGVYDEETLEDHLDNRGLMNRILRPIMKSITRPGQMYPVGMLFGLGFDTATEVALLVVASAGAAGGLPWYAILSLPILFAAGMSLFDTIDGTFMNFAYGWAFSKARPEGVLQHHDHESVDHRGRVHRRAGSPASDVRPAEPHRRPVGLREQLRPEQSRLRHRRPLRRHLGHRAVCLALRPHRGEVVCWDSDL
jgi:high-affinity nickel-transport protein